jgi:hypothetical protein
MVDIFQIISYPSKLPLSLASFNPIGFRLYSHIATNAIATKQLTKGDNMQLFHPIRSADNNRVTKTDITSFN